MRTNQFLPATFILLILFYLGNCQDSDRDRWQQPEKVMDVLGIKPGMVIGEIGVGNGYFTYNLSKRVGSSGKIFANEIDEEKLTKMSETCERENIKNIQTISGTEDDPLFPVDTLDLAIMVYVFHHLANPAIFLQNLLPSLKKGANLIILERDPEKHGTGFGHFMEKEELLDKLSDSPFEVDKIETFLERDNIYILKVK